MSNYEMEERLKCARLKSKTFKAGAKEFEKKAKAGELVCLSDLMILAEKEHQKGVQK